MKVHNLVLGLMLGVSVFSAHSAVMVTATSTAAVTAAATAMSSSNATIASSVTTNMMNSQNSVIVECHLRTENVKKDGEWFGSDVPSLKETIKDSRCLWNKKTMEDLNGTHYKFGKIKGIFKVKAADHVMIELVEINE